jgi:hypothetical protein
MRQILREARVLFAEEGYADSASGHSVLTLAYMNVSERRRSAGGGMVDVDTMRVGADPQASTLVNVRTLWRCIDRPRGL